MPLTQIHMLFDYQECRKTMNAAEKHVNEFTNYILITSVSTILREEYNVSQVKQVISSNNKM